MAKLLSLFTLQLLVGEFSYTYSRYQIGVKHKELLFSVAVIYKYKV